MVDPAPLELTPTSTLGQYEIQGRLGSGGMGDVYAAVHTALGKRVAIKTLRRRYLDDATIVARFLREGQLASRIRHPNIVDVTDVGLIGGLPCLVMEHLEGETLASFLKREGSMPPVILVDTLLPIVAALDFAHQNGVLHRDLKPANIFLSRAWNGEIVPKVLDFGISKLVDGSVDAALTTDAEFMGTPHYAAPESMRGEKLDHRADQYAMGVVLYEAATGKRPFGDRGLAFATLAIAICAADYQKPRELAPALPEALERAILRAMAVDADARFPSMRALGEALLPLASERARVIWAPTFAETADDEPPPSRGTALLPLTSSQRSGGPGTRATPPSAGPGRPPSWPGAHAEDGPPRSYAQPTSNPGVPLHPSGGPFGVHPSTGRFGVHPSGGPFGVHPSATPPPMFDRTPSYVQSMGAPLVPSPPGRSSKVGVIVGAAGVGLCVVGIVAIFAAGAMRRSAAAKAASDPIDTSADAQFEVSVQAVPEAAIFEVDGAPAGAGRFASSFPRNGQNHTLRISLAGYESVLLPFDEAHLPPPRVLLRALPATPSPPAASKPVATGLPPKAPPPPAGKSGTARPKTDNIDPWE